MGKKIASLYMRFIMPTMSDFIIQPLFQVQVDPHLFSNYLVLGYAVMWLVGFAYVMFLWVQQRNMERDIELMKRILSDSEKSNDSKFKNTSG